MNLSDKYLAYVRFHLLYSPPKNPQNPKYLSHDWKNLECCAKFLGPILLGDFECNLKKGAQISYMGRMFYIIFFLNIMTQDEQALS